MSIVQDLKLIFPHINSRRRKEFFFLFLLMLAGSIAELASLGAVVPFITVLASPEIALKQDLMQKLLRATNLHDNQLSILVSVIFGAMVLLAAGIRLFLLWKSNRVIYGFGHDLSVDLYAKTLYRPYSFHINKNTSEIIGGVNKALHVVQGYLVPLMTSLVALVFAIGIITMLVFINPFVAVGGAVSFSVIYFGIALLVRKRATINGKVVASVNDKRIQEIQEGLGGIRDVILGAAQPIYINRFDELNRNFMRAIADNIFLGVSPRYVIEGFGLLLIAVFSMYAVSGLDGITQLLPTLGALGLGAQKLMPLVQQIYQGLNEVTSNRASLHDVLNLLDGNKPRKNMPKALSFNESIILEDVCFSYKNEVVSYALRDINLTIPRGSSIGLIGVTGSGKSTLVDLLMGLLVPTQGVMKIDNVALEVESFSAWQKHISHVPQTIYLSDATIAENIAFGCRRFEIDETRMHEAARAAQISEYIEQLPSGYDSQVGERGVRLSGGQRQRIGIARALYRYADVLVLDEATSALDDKTERMVMAGINNYRSDITKIIIAHRVSTLSGCDYLIEINGGQIISKRARA